MAVREGLSRARLGLCSQAPLSADAADRGMAFEPRFSSLQFREPLIKSHRGRCGKNWPRARRRGASIPAVGCKRQANTAPGRLSPQPGGLKPFVDFCLAVSRRSRPPDCFAGYDAAPAARRCGVARSGETAACIAQHSRLQKSATSFQRPSWELISGSLERKLIFGGSDRNRSYVLTMAVREGFEPSVPFWSTAL